MSLHRWWDSARELPGTPHARVLDVTRDSWHQVMRDVAAAGRLLALWTGHGDPKQRVVSAALICDPGLLLLWFTLEEAHEDYPGIEDIFPAASRMQRAAADLTGIRSTDPDTRPWLRHSAWPADAYPLAGAALPAPVSPPPIDDYSFVRVHGEGVHEVAVGPVHAGTIEPGHFRFSVVGEKVLRLEARLGYVHKGIERRFSELPLLEEHRLAARVSGDSAVAFSWAYCQALEAMAGHRLPPRAAFLRALALEIERIANHLGDLGAIGNDSGFSFGLAQFLRLKERLLRITEQAFGQRYLMDFIVPGGTRIDLNARDAAALADGLPLLVREVATLRGIYEEHEGLRDRFAGAGIVTPDLAARLGLIGLAGRASGQDLDLRADHPWPPYADLGVAKSKRSVGDVLARVTVRFDELDESVRLVRRILALIPAGAHSGELPVPDPGTFGVGLIEGWRGPVFIALEAGEGGRIRRCHPHDPSWQNWPVLEHAIIGNIVPDFPLINKSFNLSYSGPDL